MAIPLIKPLLCTLLFFLASCPWERKNAAGSPPDSKNVCCSDTSDTSVNSSGQQESAGLLFVEDFSGGSKNSYKSGSVTFRTGIWLLDDALTARASSDQAAGMAVRIRNRGKLAMKFDLSGKVATVEIRTGVYGTDKESAIELWLSEDGGGSFSKMPEIKVWRSGNERLHNYAIRSTARMRFEIRKASDGKNRVNILSFKIFGRGVPDEGSAAERAGIPRDSLYKAGWKATSTEDNSSLLLGNPSRADAKEEFEDNYLISNPYYSLSYSRSRGCANWVSWHLGSEDIGKAARQNDFRPGEGLPASWDRPDESCYRGAGFDKGHNCPSGDRTSSSSANSSTFLMYNIIPQAPANNQNTWEHLESYCRKQLSSGNELYVIMGSYGKGGSGKYGYRTSIGESRITVPSNIWKVVLILPAGNMDLKRINAQTTVIAVNTPNSNTVSSDWMNYICTVDEIEQSAGLDLLSSLPDSLQKILEPRRFAGGH